MKTRRIPTMFVTAILLVTLSFVSTAQPRSDLLQEATGLFSHGKFAEADKICTELLKRDHKDFGALSLSGRIALLSNRLQESEKLLSRALVVKPDDKTDELLLAEAFYRQDKFQEAARLQRKVGNEGRARMLESFRDQKPYQLSSRDSAHLKFIQLDPLPLVNVSVNGSDQVCFLIDTGGAEVVLDTEFAKRIGAAQFGNETGIFAGGKTSNYQLGRVDSIRLGNLTVKNVPLEVLDTRRFDAIANGRKVEGIIGTVLLYHFLSTLDYGRGELVLAPKAKRGIAPNHIEEPASEVPFWMAGDHFMVAWGRINKTSVQLLFIDTGLAGMGFTAPESTLKEAGITIGSNYTEGIGGGGRTKAFPIKIDEIALGDVIAKNILGVAGVFPTSLENKFGFRVGGLLSHSFFKNYAVTIDFQRMKYVLRHS